MIRHLENTTISKQRLILAVYNSISLRWDLSSARFVLLRSTIFCSEDCRSGKKSDRVVE